MRKQGSGEDYIMRNLMMYSTLDLLFACKIEKALRECNKHGRGELHAMFWAGNFLTR